MRMVVSLPPYFLCREPYPAPPVTANPPFAPAKCRKISRDSCPCPCSRISLPGAGDLNPALRYPDAPIASFALETSPRTGPEHPTPSSGELIDVRAVAADLESLAQTHSGNARELRAAVAQRLKTALN